MAQNMEQKIEDIARSNAFYEGDDCEVELYSREEEEQLADAIFSEYGLKKETNNFYSFIGNFFQYDEANEEFVKIGRISEWDGEIPFITVNINGEVVYIDLEQCKGLPYDYWFCNKKGNIIRVLLPNYEYYWVVSSINNYAFVNVGKTLKAINNEMDEIFVGDYKLEISNEKKIVKKGNNWYFISQGLRYVDEDHESILFIDEKFKEPFKGKNEKISIDLYDSTINNSTVYPSVGLTYFCKNNNDYFVNTEHSIVKDVDDNVEKKPIVNNDNAPNTSSVLCSNETSTESQVTKSILKSSTKKTQVFTPDEEFDKNLKNDTKFVEGVNKLLQRVNNTTSVITDACCDLTLNEFSKTLKNKVGNANEKTNHELAMLDLKNKLIVKEYENKNEIEKLKHQNDSIKEQLFHQREILLSKRKNNIDLEKKYDEYRNSLLVLEEKKFDNEMSLKKYGFMTECNLIENQKLLKEHEAKLRLDSLNFNYESMKQLHAQKTEFENSRLMHDVALANLRHEMQVSELRAKVTTDLLKVEEESLQGLVNLRKRISDNYKQEIIDMTSNLENLKGINQDLNLKDRSTFSTVLLLVLLILGTMIGLTNGQVQYFLIALTVIGLPMYSKFVPGLPFIKVFLLSIGVVCFILIGKHYKITEIRITGSNVEDFLSYNLHYFAVLLLIIVVLSVTKWFKSAFILSILVILAAIPDVRAEQGALESCKKISDLCILISIILLCLVYLFKKQFENLSYLLIATCSWSFINGPGNFSKCFETAVIKTQSIMVIISAIIGFFVVFRMKLLQVMFVLTFLVFYLGGTADAEIITKYSNNLPIKNGSHYMLDNILDKNCYPKDICNQKIQYVFYKDSNIDFNNCDCIYVYYDIRLERNFGMIKQACNIIFFLDQGLYNGKLKNDYVWESTSLKNLGKYPKEKLVCEKITEEIEDPINFKLFIKFKPIEVLEYIPSWNINCNISCNNDNITLHMPANIYYNCSKLFFSNCLDSKVNLILLGDECLQKYPNGTIEKLRSKHILSKYKPNFFLDSMKMLNNSKLQVERIYNDSKEKVENIIKMVVNASTTDITILHPFNITNYNKNLFDYNYYVNMSLQIEEYLNTTFQIIHNLDWKTELLKIMVPFSRLFAYVITDFKLHKLFIIFFLIIRIFFTDYLRNKYFIARSIYNYHNLVLFIYLIYVFIAGFILEDVPLIFYSSLSALCFETSQQYYLRMIIITIIKSLLYFGNDYVYDKLETLSVYINGFPMCNVDVLLWSKIICCYFFFSTYHFVYLRKGSVQKYSLGNIITIFYILFLSGISGGVTALTLTLFSFLLVYNRSPYKQIQKWVNVDESPFKYYLFLNFVYLIFLAFSHTFVARIIILLFLFFSTLFLGYILNEWEFCKRDMVLDVAFFIVSVISIYQSSSIINLLALHYIYQLYRAFTFKSVKHYYKCNHQDALVTKCPCCLKNTLNFDGITMSKTGFLTKVNLHLPLMDDNAELTELNGDQLLFKRGWNNCKINRRLNELENGQQQEYACTTCDYTFPHSKFACNHFKKCMKDGSTYCCEEELLRCLICNGPLVSGVPNFKVVSKLDSSPLITTDEIYRPDFYSCEVKKIDYGVVDKATTYFKALGVFSCQSHVTNLLSNNVIVMPLNTGFSALMSNEIKTSYYYLYQNDNFLSYGMPITINYNDIVHKLILVNSHSYYRISNSSQVVIIDEHGKEIEHSLLGQFGDLVFLKDENPNEINRSKIQPMFPKSDKIYEMEFVYPTKIGGKPDRVETQLYMNKNGTPFGYGNKGKKHGTCGCCLFYQGKVYGLFFTVKEEVHLYHYITREMIDQLFSAKRPVTLVAASPIRSLFVEKINSFYAKPLKDSKRVRGMKLYSGNWIIDFTEKIPKIQHINSDKKEIIGFTPVNRVFVLKQGITQNVFIDSYAAYFYDKENFIIIKDYLKGVKDEDYLAIFMDSKLNNNLTDIINSIQGDINKINLEYYIEDNYISFIKEFNSKLNKVKNNCSTVFREIPRISDENLVKLKSYVDNLKQVTEIDTLKDFKDGLMTDDFFKSASFNGAAIKYYMKIKGFTKKEAIEYYNEHREIALSQLLESLQLVDISETLINVKKSIQQKAKEIDIAVKEINKHIRDANKVIPKNIEEKDILIEEVSEIEKKIDLQNAEIEKLNLISGEVNNAFAEFKKIENTKHEPKTRSMETFVEDNKEQLLTIAQVKLMLDQQAEKINKLFFSSNNADIISNWLDGCIWHENKHICDKAKNAIKSAILELGYERSILVIASYYLYADALVEDDFQDFLLEFDKEQDLLQLLLEMVPDKKRKLQLEASFEVDDILYEFERLYNEMRNHKNIEDVFYKRNKNGRKRAGAQNRRYWNEVVIPSMKKKKSKKQHHEEDNSINLNQQDENDRDDNFSDVDFGTDYSRDPERYTLYYPNEEYIEDKDEDVQHDSRRRVTDFYAKELEYEDKILLYEGELKIRDQELEKLSYDYEELKKINAFYNTDIANKNNIIAANCEHIEELKKTDNVKSLELSKIKEKLDEQIKQNTILIKDMEKYNQSVLNKDKLSNKINELEGCNKALESKNRALDAENKKFQKDMSQLQQQVSKNEQDQETKYRKFIEGLENKNKQLEEENQRHILKLQKIEEQIQKLNEKHNIDILALNDKIETEKKKMEEKEVLHQEENKRIQDKFLKDENIEKEKLNKMASNLEKKEKKLTNTKKILKERTERLESKPLVTVDEHPELIETIESLKQQKEDIKNMSQCLLSNNLDIKIVFGLLDSVYINNMSGIELSEVVVLVILDDTIKRFQLLSNLSKGMNLIDDITKNEFELEKLYVRIYSKGIYQFNVTQEGVDKISEKKRIYQYELSKHDIQNAPAFRFCINSANNQNNGFLSCFMKRDRDYVIIKKNTNANSKDYDFIPINGVKGLNTKQETDIFDKRKITENNLVAVLQYYKKNVYCICEYGFDVLIDILTVMSKNQNNFIISAFYGFVPASTVKKNDTTTNIINKSKPEVSSNENLQNKDVNILQNPPQLAKSWYVFVNQFTFEVMPTITESGLKKIIELTFEINQPNFLQKINKFNDYNKDVHNFAYYIYHKLKTSKDHKGYYNLEGKFVSLPLSPAQEANLHNGLYNFQGKEASWGMVALSNECEQHAAIYKVISGYHEERGRETILVKNIRSWKLPENTVLTPNSGCPGDFYFLEEKRKKQTSSM